MNTSTSEAVPQASQPPLSNVSLADRAYRIRRNALRMGEVQGQGYIAQALGVADVLAVSYFHAMQLSARGPGMGGARPLPPVDRPLRHCALRGPDRGRDHPGGRARELRLRRQPPAHVGHGRLHARHGDHRRVARPWPGARGRVLPRAEAQEVELVRLLPVLRRRARRGLRLGRGLVGQPLEARQPDRHRRRQQPAGGRPRLPGHGLRAARRRASSRSAGTCSASTATTSMPWSRRSTRPATSTSRSRASSSATPRWPRAFRSSRSASATTSCGWSRTNGRRPSNCLTPGGHHEALEIHTAGLARGAGRRRTRDGGQAAADHLGDDRLARRPGPAHEARPVRPRPCGPGRDAGPRSWA